MNILFLVPPVALNDQKSFVDRIYGCTYGFDYKPPIHLLLLATVAKQLGHRVRLLDCPAEKYSVKKFISYLENEEDIAMVVFFTVWLSKKEDLEAAGIVSNVFKGVRVVFTGPYPTWKPEQFLKNSGYCVIRGEPEETFKELIGIPESGSDILSNTKGISFLGKEGIINTDPRPLIDLDALPFPDRTLLKGEEYIFNRLNEYPATALCVSRGCSFRCTYCAPHALDQAIELEFLRTHQEKPPLRLRQTGLVIKEFREIARLGYRAVEITDNQFVWSKERMLVVCDALKPLGLEWICYARADHLKDEQVVRAMGSAGCESVFIGTDSFSQQILDDVKKDMLLQDNYDAVKMLKRCGIEPEISLIFGASLLETKSTIRHSIRQAQRCRTPFLHYSIALPLPNTQLYRLARERGLLKDEDFFPVDNIRESVFQLPGVTSSEIRRVVRRCYRQHYVSVGFVLKQLASIRSMRVLKNRLKALARFVAYLCRSRI